MTRLLLCALVLLSTSACLDRMILDGTLKSTRDAASAFDTLPDLEVAKAGAASSLVQIEGMQKLAPDNEDGLFLLLQGWTAYAGAFIEDDWEQAVDRGDDEAEEANATRARLAYDRALEFGTLLVERHHPGFVEAIRNIDTMKAWLAPFDKSEAEMLLWMGAAWMSRVGVAAERPELVAELFVGEALLARSVELDDSLAWSLGLCALGAYHARAPDAELAQAKELFEKALAKTGRKALTAQVMYAQSYACNAHDKALYVKLLEEALEGGEEKLPEQRLENAMARRKAKRYLGAPRLKRCGF
jgi:hypothetical protein